MAVVVEAFNAEVVVVVGVRSCGAILYVRGRCSDLFINGVKARTLLLTCPGCVENVVEAAD